MKSCNFIFFIMRFNNFKRNMIVEKNVNSINEIEINKYDIYVLLKKEYVLIQLFIRFS